MSRPSTNALPAKPTRAPSNCSSKPDPQLAHGVPVPLSEIACGDPLPESVIVTFALCAPVPAGANATSIVQFAAGASVAPHVVSITKSAAPVPVTVIPVMSRIAVPWLVTVTLFAAELVPCVTDPNASVVALSVTESAATPVPLSATVCGEPDALSETIKLALKAEAFAGRKAIITWQLALAPSDPPKSVTSTNDAGFAPPIEIDLIETAAVVWLVTMTICASLSAPTWVFGKVTDVGDRTIDPAAAPVPVSVTFCGEPAALSAICRVALCAPVAAGLNVTVIVQLLPSASVGPQFVVNGNDFGSAPVMLMPPLAMSSVATPLLVSVTACDALLDPTLVGANASLPAERDAAAARAELHAFARLVAFTEPRPVVRS